MTRAALAARAAGPDAARPARPRSLAWVPALTLGLFLGPIAVGLVGTLLPAFGLLPALGATVPTLQPWRDLAAAPGFATAVRLSAATGLASTLLALAVALSVAACWHGTRWFQALRGLLAPLLAVPHAAFAVGFAFLVAPSGWIARLASPWATGWERPPDLLLVNDPWGLALTLALAAKEVPFLLMMVIAALGQVRADQALTSARCMGYGPVAAWLKTVLPLVWPQIRLPVYAVLAFSLSVVDMALVLGPGTPPTLAVLILRWFNDPDLSLRFQAAAAASVQVALVAAAIGLFRTAEMAVGRLLRGWVVSGRRGGPATGLRVAALAGFGAVAAAAGGALAVLAVWSVAARWRFPDALPADWNLDRWTDALPGLAGPIANTVAAAALSTGIALALVLGCLEHEQRSGRGRPTSRGLWLLYAPLLVPQIGFLFGVQVLLVLVGLDGTWPALVWSHLLFVLPYVFLALADPYRALDERYARSARCMGASPGRVFRTITLPLLARPIAVAAAVGMSVSVAQYLPTVFAGAGRLPTVTTEAVALAGGGDRRALAVVAFVQMLLPLLGFAAALAAGRRR
ncbi:ABC transporter permease [Arenibaculum sp.]|uniref:ABC transporter permease n=1 Tax=Arenibaculum sp. TaxID=2865862 RepID=UPI002E12EB0F|nr:ABC transporter permease subunit [Arenibaculum sp.]